MLRKGMFISDRYEILDKVGSGGMSDVYKAKCHKLNRYVAIKVLKQEFSEDKNFVSKFKVEAQSAASLSHPNIVSIFDVGDDNGLYYIVMELIEGITLKRYIQKKGQLSVKEATSIAIQVAQGIECAHNNHIIHRDIKPQNIIISKEGKVKVTDFGIARAVSANTINSNAMGSVHYISPEQARGGYIDEKSDIYSLGITLFEMLTGQMPYEGDSTVAIALQHIQGELPNVRELTTDLPISTEKIVQKCTQKKSDRRYLKISSLISDLKRSLVTPNEDFVQLVPAAPVVGETVLFDPEDVKAGVLQTSIEDLDDGFEEDNLENDDDDTDEDDIDVVNPKLDRIITIGGIVAGVVLLTIIIMLVVKFVNGGPGSGPNDPKVTDQSTLSDDYVYMPDLYNKTTEEAEALLKKNNLGRNPKYKYAPDNKVEKDKVCGQSVKAGEVVAKHTDIEITISEGIKEFEPENYAGQNLDDVKKALVKLGLKAKVDYQFHSTIATNIVISSSPLAPATVKYGDTINLIVSKGKQFDEDATVPNLKGATKEEAIQKLKDAGLRPGIISTEASDEVDANIVMDQDNDSGEKLPRNTAVNFVVSSGSAQVTVPNLENLTESSAGNSLKQAGLQLGNVTSAYHDTIAVGKVISQSIQPGSKAKKNTAVNIVISKGKDPANDKVYKATVTININDLNDNGALSDGNVVIKIDGEQLNLGQYNNLSTWPSSTWTYEIKRPTARRCTVVATVNGVEKFRLPVNVN